MRCKVGDLAVIVMAKHAVNIGKIVRIISASNTQKANFGEIFTEINGNKFRKSTEGFVWFVDAGNGTIVYDNGHTSNTGPCPDNILRPIRDNPGQDETLQWAPVPHKETA